MQYWFCARRFPRMVAGPRRTLARPLARPLVLGLATVIAAAAVSPGCGDDDGGGGVLPSGVTLTEAERVPGGAPLGPATPYAVECPTNQALIGFLVWVDRSVIQALAPLCSPLFIEVADDGEVEIASEEPPTPAGSAAGDTREIVEVTIRNPTPPPIFIQVNELRERTHDSRIECAFNSVVVGRQQTRSDEGLTSFAIRCAAMLIGTDGSAVGTGKIDTSAPIPLGADPPLESADCAAGETFVDIEGTESVFVDLDAGILDSAIMTVGGQCAAVGLTF